MADRAILFIDGNNWYHALRNAGVTDLMNMDYAKLSEKPSFGWTTPAGSQTATRPKHVGD